MQQVDANTYKVSAGEAISVSFTGSGVSCRLATLVVDQIALPTPAGCDWRFSATKPAGQRHHARFDCPFPPATPGTAFYDITVSGSNGGSFTGPHVTSGGLTQQALRFEVV